LKLGVRTRLFLLSFGLIVLSVVAAHTYLSAALDRWLTDRVRGDLRVRLSLVEREAAEAPHPAGDLTSWDRLADDLGRRAAARVTLIDRAGVVLGDSEVELSALPRVENHGRRPEVVAALRGGRGESTRLSTTVGQRMLYLARPFGAPHGAGGVARVALPLVEVDAALSRLGRLVTIGMGLALGLAVLMSSVAAQLASKGARSLTAVARRMAAGDLAARSHATGSDEFAELGRTLNRLAESLEGTLAQLRGERDLLGGVLDGMQEGVLLIGAEGRIDLVNPALREMLLLDAGVTGRSLLEAIRHADLKGLLDRSLREGGPASGEIETAGLRPRSLLVRAAPLAGRPGALLAVFVDVTDLKRLESMRRDFVANVSHELRTPIAAVRSAAETLRSGALADREAGQRFLEIIERNAERLERLVEDLMDLTRMESRRYQLDLEPVDLEPLLDRVVELHRDRANARRIALRTSLSAAARSVRADRRALEQVLSNLVDNAVKYSREGAEVTVAAEPDGAMLRIAVSDDGPGIEARHLSRLFERFYRVDAGRSREQGGTGLGLAIVKHLCEAMGGTVDVASQLGKGTTFKVSLRRA